MSGRPRLSASTHMPIRIIEMNSERLSSRPETSALYQYVMPAYRAVRSERTAKAIRQSGLRCGMTCTLGPHLLRSAAGEVHDHAREQVEARLDGAQVDELGVVRVGAEALQAEALED